MLRFFSLSSGSCGNCYYLGTEDTGILIDAGVSLRSVSKVFKANDVDMDSVCGILVTHTHLDHVRSLGSFCKKLHKPVYTTSTIAGALARHRAIGDTSGLCRDITLQETASMLTGIKVRTFEVPHDAVQTVGYSIEMSGHRFVIMTDIGRMTDEAMSYAAEADTLVIESNYDIDMLMAGPYTYDLKMRIVRGNGHLSNDECASSLKRIASANPGLKNIFLCHLSENNNTPEKAYAASSQALSEAGVPAGTIQLRCLPRRFPSQVFFL